MAKTPTIDERLAGLLENYRVLIGAGLILMILAGSLALSVKEGRKKSDGQPAPQTVEQQLNELREQNEQLKKQLEEIVQSKESTGQVAGTKASAPKSRSTRTTSSRPPPTGSRQQQSGLININTANQAALESLPRIGPAIAKRIIEYRETQGAFRTIEQIKDVKGIGDKTFEQFRDLITVE